MVLRVEVYADPICPWCFIGKRRLERVLGDVAQDGAVEILWRAFQLNPSMPPEGMDRGAYLAAKFGGAERARQVYDVIRREGEAEGIAFAFARIARTPNTVAAQRLVKFAQRSSRAGTVMARLFEAYFLEGRDIGANAELARLAGESGLDVAAAQAFLAGDEGRDEVLAEDGMARHAGIGGVPHFVIGGRYALPGAQSPEVIARAIELARAAEAAAPSPTGQLPA